jgi:hypothetical protein
MYLIRLPILKKPSSIWVMPPIRTQEEARSTMVRFRSAGPWGNEESAIKRETTVVNVARMRRMAKYPVMLACLCVVHWNEKRLPEGKADLLMAVLRWLLDAKEEKRLARGYSNTFAGECFKSLALAMTRYP